MFSSVSSCVPNSQVRLNFVSGKAQKLDVPNNVNLYINGSLTALRPVNLITGDFVEVELTTPPTYLGYAFYNYILDDVEHAFAVVNTNDYRPTVKIADVPKRWFNYFPLDIRTSFYDQDKTTSRPMGRGSNFVDIDRTHVVLDHIRDRVNFYSTNRELVTTVYLPAGPVEYKKTTYTDNSGNTRVEVFVLCSDKKLYSIRFDNRFSDSQSFNPAVRTVRGLEQIWFEADLANGTSFLTSRQLALRNKTNPSMTALDIVDNTVWVAGYDTVCVLDKDFLVLRTIKIPDETLISLACLDDTNAYAIARDGKVYHIGISGTYNLIYDAQRALGSPARFQIGNGAPFILIPDPNNQRLLKITGPTAPIIADSWLTPGHAPAYARAFEDKLVVTSHDNNVVLVYTDKNNRKDYAFSEKVTLASLMSGLNEPTVLAVHYLENYVVLDLSGIEKVISVDFQPIKGPITQIGSDPYKLIMLGQESILAHPGPRLTYWVNGINGELANTGDNLGVSFKAYAIGNYRTAVVIGETAFDIDVEVFDDSAAVFTSAYSTSVGLNKIIPLMSANVITTPTIGNVQSGTTSIDLGFNLNFFGNVYSSINVSTNGYITFGNSTPTGIVSNIGALNVDALYVEPKDLYQGLPITNINPPAVTTRALPSGQTPAVYYETGTRLGFSYAKIRWVGTKGFPTPAGNTVVLPVTISNSYDIPVEPADFLKATANDYVSSSSNSIIQPTQVVGTYSTLTFNFTVYKVVPSNTALVTYTTNGPTSVADYSRLLGYSNYAIAKSNILKQSTAPRGNYLLDIHNNILVMDDAIDPAVTNDWAIRIPVAALGSNPPYVYQTGITNIVTTTANITYIAPLDPNLNLGTNRFTVSSSDYGNILLNQKINRSIPGATVVVAVVSKTIIGSDYVVTVSSNHNLSVNDTCWVTKTEITTASNMPTVANGVLLQNTVAFEYASITFSNSQGLAVGNISLKGSFVTVGNTVSVASGSIVNFKGEEPVEEYNYEVAFYQGSKYQYIEYFYDNTFHSSTTNIGMSTGTRIVGNKLLSNTVPAYSSILYGSPTGSGVFTPLGIGSFNFLSVFVPKAPKFSKGPNSSDYEYTVEFYIEQDIQPSANVYLSTSYGSLTVNGGFYNSYRPIKKNDLVQLTTPFNRSLRSIAPLVSISNTQFPVPMIANAAHSLLTEHLFMFGNQPIDTIISANIIVPASDSYYIPDMYRTAGGINSDFEYILNRSGNLTLASDGIYDLFAGDILYVNGILTSAIQYDTRDVVLIGQNNAIVIRTETVGPALVDTLSFSTLIDPYTVNYNYNITSSYVEYTTAYETANLLLTSNAGVVTADLYIGDVGTEFKINGNLKGNYVTNVPIGSNIAVRRDLVDYFQSNVIIYQVIQDPIARGNVFVPVGNWNIQNKIITGALNVSSTILTPAKFESQFDKASIVKTNKIISSKNLPAINTSLGKIKPLLHKNLDTFNVIGTQPLKISSASYTISNINSKFYRISSYLNFKLAEASLYKKNDSKVNSVIPKIESVYTYKLIDAITNQYRDQGSYLNGRIAGSVLKKENELYINSIKIKQSFASTFFKHTIIGKKISKPAHLLINSIIGKQISPFNYLSSRMHMLRINNSSILASNITPKFEVELTFIDIGMLRIAESNTTYLVNEEPVEVINNFNYLTNETESKKEVSSVGHLYKFDTNILVGESQSSASQESEFEISPNSYLASHQVATDKIIQEMKFKMVKRRARLPTEIISHIDLNKINIASEVINHLTWERDSITSESTISNLMLRNDPNTEMVFSHELKIPIPNTEFYFYHGEFDVFQSSLGFSQKRSFFKFDYNIGIGLPRGFELIQDTVGFSINYGKFIDYPLELITPLIPQVRNFTILDIPFTPIEDLPPLYLLPLIPILDSPPETLLPLPAMLDIVPDLIIPLDPYLYQEIVWKMDDMIPEVGAYKTHIHYWIHQAFYDHKWNVRKVPEMDVDYDPFVLYTKDYVYKPGGFISEDTAEDEKVKYYNAGVLQIPGTDFWNYRIYFNDRHFCVPKKGRIFPMTWYLRGG